MKGLIFGLIGVLLLQQAVGYVPLTVSELKCFAGKKEIKLLDPTNSAGFLEPILKIRTPGSEGSQGVREHFKRFFDKIGGWQVEFDSFLQDTPTQKAVNFTNVIVTRDPPGVEKRLTLVAHYDSKIEPQGFLGAIDSAFPCALMIYVAQQLKDALASKFQTESKLGLQLVFLDGEEAFEEWSATDSIYGARNLAARWESESKLGLIDMFVLLDLLGAKNPSISSFYENTDWAHKKLKELEKNLRKLKLTKYKRSQDSWFPRPGRFFLGGQLGDDHEPFLQRGVPVLHVIPLPFPETWHELTDDGEHLDENAIHDWGMLMTAFVAEYLELSGHLGIDLEPDL